jgi:hypothetical protein
MVSIRGITVSGNHYIWDDVTHCMVRADRHSEADICASVPILYCLGTSSNWIPLVDANKHVLMCADYEESSEPEVVAAAQAAAETALNGFSGPTVQDYSLGLDPTTFVQMSDGSWVLADSVRIGDVLASGAWVVGLVTEECEEMCITPGFKMISAAQLVQRTDGGPWLRAAHIWPTLRTYSRRLTQFITSDGGPLIVADSLDSDPYAVRDYQEWAGPEVQSIYDRTMEGLKQCSH